MELEPTHARSNLFTVRLWEENLGAGEKEWRGRIQNIATGEITHFRDWPGLVSALTRMVEAHVVAQPPEQAAPPPSDALG